MLTEVKSLVKLEDLKAKQDGIGLLRLIREVICSVEKHPQDTRVLVIVDKALHTFYERPDVPNDKYIKLFNSHVMVLETLGGPLPFHL